MFVTAPSPTARMRLVIINEGGMAPMTDDPEWKRIVKHFADAFSTRNPNAPQAELETFVDSLAQTLRQALGGRSIEFADVEDAKAQESDDLGSVLILAGSLLYRVR